MAAVRKEKGKMLRLAFPDPTGWEGRQKRSGEQTPSPCHWTRRSNSPDREGPANGPGGAVPGWATDQKLSVPGVYGSGKTRTVEATAVTLLKDSRFITEIF